MTSKELREKVVTLIQKGRQVIDQAEKDKRGLTAEDQEQIKRVHVEAAAAKADLEATEAQERFEVELKQPVKDGLEGRGGSLVPRDNGNQLPPAGSRRRPRNEADLAFRGWLMQTRNLADQQRPEHIQAMQRFGLDRAGDTIDVRLPRYDLMAEGPARIRELRNALSEGIDTAGGFLVPPGFIQALEVALLAFGAMRQVATIMRTDTGVSLPIPTTNDTGNEGIEVAENQTIVEATNPTFGAVEMRAYTYTSRYVPASNQLIRDSSVDIGALLGRLIGERLARIQNRRCTTADGAAKPRGIVTAATLGVTAAAAAALDTDEILTLIHSVDPAYRTQAGFMMHDAVLLQVSLLKDGNGAYVLQPGLADGTPYRLRGYPVIPNQHMAAAVAASATVMLFGQLSKYLIREVGTLRIQRLLEIAALQNAQLFLGFMDFDGNLIDAGTHPVRSMVMHA